MNLEAHYKEALELTHRMLASARTQDWDTLTHAGEQRAALVQKAAQQHDFLSVSQQQRIA